VRSYAAAWKKYWGEYIPELIRTKSVPDKVAWGSYPTLKESVSTTASETYNVLVHSFTPAGLKGIIFLPNQDMVAADQGAKYGEQLSALANGWKQLFGGDPAFIYGIPGKNLAAAITAPTTIKGKSTGVEIGSWTDKEAVLKVFATAAAQN
jgi:predicted small lipoprotein YifL